MKKSFWIIMLVLAAGSFCYAQTEQGTVLVGTSTNLVGTNFSLAQGVNNNAGISFGSTKFKSDDFESESEGITTFNLAPKVGFFVADNALLALDLSFAYLKEENDDDALTSINAGPFFRYYFSAGNFYPFVQAQFGIGQISFGDGANNKTNLMNYGAAAGGAFFVGDKVSIDLLLGFNHQQAKEKENDNNARSIANVFGFAVGVSVFL